DGQRTRCGDVHNPATRRYPPRPTHLPAPRRRRPGPLCYRRHPASASRPRPALARSRLAGLGHGDQRADERIGWSGDSGDGHGNLQSALLLGRTAAVAALSEMAENAIAGGVVELAIHERGDPVAEMRHMASSVVPRRSRRVPAALDEWPRPG